MPLVCGGGHDAVAVSITAPHPRKITQLTINSTLDLSLKLVLFFLSSNAIFSACLPFRCGSGWWGKFVILNQSVPSLGNCYFCLFQSRPTRRSKLSRRFEGAASLPSLETPTRTSALLLRWYSLLWLSATPNQVWASALPCRCT